MRRRVKVTNCLICTHYCKNPCECEHCEDGDNFSLSTRGKELVDRIVKEYLPTITVGDVLKNFISMGSDVVVVKLGFDGSEKLIHTHTKDHMSEDDTPYDIRKIPILSVGVDSNYPEKLVIWVGGLSR